MIKVLLVALLTMLTTPAYAKANLEAESALVMVITNDEEGDTYQCSGSHLGNGVVLTAAHCIMDQLTVYDGVVFKPVTVLWVNRPADVALLYVRDMGLSPSVSLDCRELPIGAPIEAVGIPYGFRNVHTFGQVASRQVNIPGRRASWEVGQLVTLIIEGGMSGGMALDADGWQVGLLVGTFGRLGVIVPASAVCKLMG